MLQPINGYRIAIDPFLLTGCIKAIDGESFLDVGSGVGIIAILLKERFTQSYVCGIEKNKQLYQLSVQNAKDNALDINFILDDINNYHIGGKQFDHIVTNPPYYNQKNFRRSINKGDANYETIELKQWIDFCMQSLKKHGKLHLIHLPSRLGDILNALHGQAGKIVITPIYSKKNQNAKRVIVQCEKGSQSDTVITSNIVVHNTDGGYTDTVKSFLLNCGRE